MRHQLKVRRSSSKRTGHQGILGMDQSLSLSEEVSFFLANDERMHLYQRGRTSTTLWGFELRKAIETGRLVEVVMTRLVGSVFVSYFLRRNSQGAIDLRSRLCQTAL